VFATRWVTLPCWLLRTAWADAHPVAPMARQPMRNAVFTATA